MGDEDLENNDAMRTLRCSEEFAHLGAPAHGRPDAAILPASRTSATEFAPAALGFPVGHRGPEINETRNGSD
jgi:hypothetical protein